MPTLKPAPDSWTREEAAHLLNRAGFGGSPPEIDRLHALGRHAAVESLVAPEEPLAAFPLPGWAEKPAMLAQLRSQVENQREMRMAMRDLSPEEAEKKRREARRAIQQDRREQGTEAQAWWFERILKSQAPLREKMTLFWHDHFATSAQKVRQPALMVQQNDLFRRHAFGSFKELAHAVTVDPAMALYLDTGASKKGKPNENYAREVMELFTLGEGNYSEDDIREAARAFTGYSLNRRDGTVTHNQRQWDDGEKTVLGKTGNWTGADVVDILFEQEAAARYVPSKLWAFFVEDEPPAEIVDRLAKGFRKSGFDTGRLLRRVFRSEAFYRPEVVRAQIKSPVQFLIGLFKQLELAAPPARYILNAQQQLGQSLFLPPNVAGWDWGKAWINTNTLLARYNIAGVASGAVAPGGRTGAGMRGRPGNEAEMEMEEAEENPARRRRAAAAARTRNRAFPGPDYAEIAPGALRRDPAALVDALVDRLFQAPVPDAARQSFLDFATPLADGGLTDHEVAELAHLMMSTPLYQLT